MKGHGSLSFFYITTCRSQEYNPYKNAILREKRKDENREAILVVSRVIKIPGSDKEIFAPRV